MREQEIDTVGCILVLEAIFELVNDLAQLLDGVADSANHS